MSFHVFLSATNSLHLLTHSSWRSLSTSYFHLFLGLPLLLVLSSSWVKIFLGILSSILSRWPNQLILCPFIHFTRFSPFLISSSSRFVRLFHSLFPYLGPYILLNIFLSKISRACSSFFVIVHAFTPFYTTGLIRSTEIRIDYPYIFLLFYPENVGLTAFRDVTSWTLVELQQMFRRYVLHFQRKEFVVLLL